MARPQPPFEQRLRIPGSNVRNHGLYRSHLPDAQSSYSMKLLKHPLNSAGRHVVAEDGYGRGKRLIDGLGLLRFQLVPLTAQSMADESSKEVSIPAELIERRIYL